MQVAPHTVMHWSSAVPDELSAIDGADAPKWSEKTLDEVTRVSAKGFSERCRI